MRAPPSSSSPSEQRGLRCRSCPPWDCPPWDATAEGCVGPCQGRQSSPPAPRTSGLGRALRLLLEVSPSVLAPGLAKQGAGRQAPCDLCWPRSGPRAFGYGRGGGGRNLHQSPILILFGVRPSISPSFFLGLLDWT